MGLTWAVEGVAQSSPYSRTEFPIFARRRSLVETTNRCCMATATPTIDTTTETGTESSTDKPWQVLLHNDQISIMEYVVAALRDIFGYDAAKCELLMLEAHENGKAAVADGTREQAEHWAARIHSYTLWATVRKAP